MKNSLLIKKPVFEEAKVIRFVPDPNQIYGEGASADGHMLVGVEYDGQEVHLLVKERLHSGEYKGQIIGFSPGGRTYKDLSVGEEVLFRALNISWICK